MPPFSEIKHPNSGSVTAVLPFSKFNSSEKKGIKSFTEAAEDDLLLNEHFTNSSNAMQRATQCTSADSIQVAFKPNDSNHLASHSDAFSLICHHSFGSLHLAITELIRNQWSLSTILICCSVTELYFKCGIKANQFQHVKCWNIIHQ